MTTTYFITGANRGIGYELAKKISENKDNVVVATTRSWARAEQLKELKRSNLEIIQLDVTHSVDQLKAALGKLKILQENGVDVFIQNAGIYLEAGASTATHQLSTTLTSSMLTRSLVSRFTRPSTHTGLERTRALLRKLCMSRRLLPP